MSRNGPAQPPSGRELFGRVAVRRGFVSEEQLNDGLARQKALAAERAPHKLIGMILLETGALGTTELIDVLREMNVPLTPKTERRVAPG
jgi:hypothetical protein